jgi:drug/metabolite transporter (DMT)-like permease
MDGFMTSARARYRLGFVLVTASAVAWSTAGFFTRLIPLDSGTMLFWRGLFGGLGILLFIAVRHRRKTFRSFRAMGRPAWSFALVSTFGMLCYIAAFRLTTVAHVAIVYATVPFIAAGLAWLAMRERPAPHALAASLAALLGVGIMVGLGGEGHWLGDLLAFAMTASLAVMMVISRRYQGIPVMQAACVSAFLSAFVSIPFAADLAVSGSDLVKLALFGLVNLSLGLVLFTLGARLLPAIETGLIGSLDAPLAPIWVWLAFAETPAKATLIGGLVVFAAVAAHILAGARAPPVTAGAD